MLLFFVFIHRSHPGEEVVITAKITLPTLLLLMVSVRFPPCTHGSCVRRMVLVARRTSAPESHYREWAGSRRINIRIRAEKCVFVCVFCSVFFSVVTTVAIVWLGVVLKRAKKCSWLCENQKETIVKRRTAAEDAQQATNLVCFFMVFLTEKLALQD